MPATTAGCAGLPSPWPCLRRCASSASTTSCPRSCCPSTPSSWACRCVRATCHGPSVCAACHMPHATGLLYVPHAHAQPPHAWHLCAWHLPSIHACMGAACTAAGLAGKPQRLPTLLATVGNRAARTSFSDSLTLRCVEPLAEPLQPKVKTALHLAQNRVSSLAPPLPARPLLPRSRAPAGHAGACLCALQAVLAPV